MPLEQEVVFALATAESLSEGMTAVAELVRRACGAVCVEWWADEDGCDVEPAAVAGEGGGRRQLVPLGPLGELVVHGGSLLPRLADTLRRLEPIVRRRRADEHVEQLAVRLAERNAALEDYAALVAHELKNPLHAALASGDPAPLEDALDLVDALLETARRSNGETAHASAHDALDKALVDLGAEDVEVFADLPDALPVPATPLRVILRNLLSNAVAADARHVRVTAVHTDTSWQLRVDDDGIGLSDADGYDGGSGVGFSLSRRMAERFGGALQLASRPQGGTRATLVLKEATQ
jgi:signal transduction histidine kinase